MVAFCSAFAAANCRTHQNINSNRLISSFGDHFRPKITCRREKLQRRISQVSGQLKEAATAGLESKVRSNTRAIAFPRQVAMYIVKQLTTASLPETGRLD
jgi:chromosomal replication initiation ATPase DnaA